MSESTPPIEEEILEYYARIEEEDRLDIGDGALEFARSQELISRYLPHPPGVVLEVGGGPGRYSFGWLTKVMKSISSILSPSIWSRRSSAPWRSPPVLSRT